MILGIGLLIIIILGTFPDFFSELFGETPKPVAIQARRVDKYDAAGNLKAEYRTVIVPDFIPEDWTQ